MPVPVSRSERLWALGLRSRDAQAIAPNVALVTLAQPSYLLYLTLSDFNDWGLGEVWAAAGAALYRVKAGP